MSTLDLLPSWETIERDYIVRKLPGLFIIRANPRLALFVDDAASRIGATFLLTEQSQNLLSPVDAITISEVSISGARHLEIATTDRNLFRNFFLLLSDLTADVLDGSPSIYSALMVCLQRWQALLQQVVVLSEERQAGLFGEIWVLRRLCESIGSDAIEAWTGPAGQSHDFRIGQNEIEVKTTTSSRRLHIINGVNQLLPSPGCSLFIASIQLVHGGTGGETLPEAIAAMRAMLEGSPVQGAKFDNALNSIGYRDIDSPYYGRRRRIADQPVLVPVTAGCPHLTADALALLPPAFASERIIDVNYQVDLTGLGFPDGSQPFLAVIPKL